ncbi:MAG: glycosyltransferase family 4 protein [Euryarchaeota archaeon]|nr:glycosyltransferase family 4 protein [Euryarchaeota archaeon]MBU4607930.1 glycosyltransferase family 4 protein [Euryarchaeota archaeon]MBV1728976.1 glycosyltransferase family 4 protein [Methanobacterium sp.]MBV1754759.1 glycosyltransferase family 4 protein [Methanobacterium sp.]
MKVCMVGHFPPHVGGIASYVYLLSNALLERGDEVYVLTYPHEKIDQTNLQVEYAPTPQIPGLRGFIFTFTATLKLIRMVRKNDIDLIHAHYLLPPGLVAVIGGILTGKKTCITLHGSDVFLLSSRKFLKPFFHMILKKADEVFVVSKSLEDKILKMNIPGVDKKLKVTWNGVDVEKFNPQNASDFKKEIGIAEDKPLVLFLGNLVRQKGVHYLLRAKNFMDQPAFLAIVGGGPLLQDLKGMAEYENIKDVHFTGARYDIDKIIPAAELLVLPSLSESFGIALLEAMASGKPVVATSVGGIPELVSEDVGILVEPRNPVALAEAIDLILENKDLREKMGKQAREKALKYANVKIPY